MKRFKDRHELDKVLALIAIFSVSLRWLIPPNIILNSMNDDALSVHLSRNILDSGWLGGWGINTLAKPPGYSIFLSLSHFTLIEPHILIHTGFVLVTFLLIKTLNVKSRNSTRVIFALIVFNPVLFSPGISRYYQIGLTSLLMYISIVLLIYAQKNMMVLDRKRDSQVCIAQGLTLGFLLITRQGIIWFIVLTILTYIGLYLISSSQRKQITKLAKSFMTLMSSLLLFPVAVIFINHSAYGYAGIDDFYYGKFAAVSKLWMSVEGESPTNPAQPIDKEKRTLVYSISPTAQSLRETLEGNPGKGWKSGNCNAVGVCDESGGAWFPWELRDAVVNAGKIKSEREFQSFLTRIEKEILDACKEGSIKCGNQGSSSVTASLMEYPIIEAIRKNWRWVKSLALSDFFTPYNIVNLSDEAQMADFSVWQSTVNLRERSIVSTEDQSRSKIWLGSSTRSLFFVLLLALLFSLKHGTQTSDNKMLRKRKKNKVRNSPRQLISEVVILIYLALTVWLGVMILSLTDLTYGFNIDTNLYNLPLALPFTLLFVLTSIGISQKSFHLKKEINQP